MKITVNSSTPGHHPGQQTSVTPVPMRIEVDWDITRKGSPIQIGLELLRAKRRLGLEVFNQVIDSGLSGFDPIQADRLIRIASNPVLANPQHRASIPVTESALACLTDVPAEVLPIV